MTDDDAIDLIEGYDDWRKKRAQSEPDLSARAYLAEQRAARLLEHGNALETAVTEALGTLEGAIYAYKEVIPRELVEGVFVNLRQAL